MFLRRCRINSLTCRNVCSCFHVNPCQLSFHVLPRRWRGSSACQIGSRSPERMISDVKHAANYMQSFCSFVLHNASGSMRQMIQTPRCSLQRSLNCVQFGAKTASCNALECNKPALVFDIELSMIKRGALVGCLTMLHLPTAERFGQRDCAASSQPLPRSQQPPPAQ